MKRLFVAIDLPEPIKAQLKPLYSGLSDAKWAQDEQLHLTLRFIGDTDSQQQTAIQTGLATIRITPFDLMITGIGQFPPKRPARVLWAGLQASAELTELQRQVEMVIRKCGFRPDEQGFSAHITLARFRTSPSLDSINAYFEHHAGFKSDHFPVHAFTLYASELTPRGSIYHCEAVFPLR